MREIIKNFRTRAAWEAARSTFAVLGVGSTLAYMGAMHLVMAVFSVILVSGTWYGMYRMYE
jgi:hypothetical protein